MIEFLRKASEAYYRGEPFLTDAQFDALADAHSYNEVGYSAEGRIKHLFPLLSLQKVYDDEALPDFNTRCVVTHKLDGVAVALQYSNGVLVSAATRGDGHWSDVDLTEKCYAWDEIPKQLSFSDDERVQVTGEVVCVTGQDNPRNFAAGAMNTKDVPQFLEKASELQFVAYGMKSGSEPHSTYLEELAALFEAGFRIPPRATFRNGEVEELPQSTPTDGLVYRMNDNAQYYKLGSTSHHPRGAFALKKRQLGVETTLREVLWQVGKSGKVSPVAIFDPVIIGNAKVQRATLHNKAYLEALGLEIGCQISVIRSGEIIPRVVCRLD